jgi:hypothetical protein
MRETAGYTGTDYKTKHSDYERTKYNPSFGHTAGIQKELVATYTKNAP